MGFSSLEGVCSSHGPKRSRNNFCQNSKSEHMVGAVCQQVLGETFKKNICFLSKQAFTINEKRNKAPSLLNSGDLITLALACESDKKPD